MIHAPYRYRELRKKLQKKVPGTGTGDLEKKNEKKKSP